MTNEHNPERRKNGNLTDEQIQDIKKQIMASIYEDIGRSLVKKILWALGAVLFALLTWLTANHIIIK